MQYRSLSIFSLTLLLLAALTHRAVFLAGNETSRFAQIEALVDYGHTYIDESRYHRTIDRVTIAGRDYSNKPPLLSVLGAGVYYILDRGLGLSFASHEAATIYLLTLILVGIPTAWLTARFDAALSIYPSISPAVRNLTTLALAAATILTSFSVTFSNHPAAAVLLFAACQAAWSGDGSMAGMWAALLTCIDIVPGVVFVPFLGLMLRETGDRRALRRYVVALAIGAMGFVALNWSIVGYPLPAKMVPGGVDMSQVPSTARGGALDRVNVTLPVNWLHPLQALFGWHGFFSVSPVLLFGAAGMLRSIRDGGPLPRRCSLLLGMACAVLTVGHAVFVGSFGGWSYGYRFLIAIVPTLLFFAPRAIAPGRAGVFVAVLAVSMAFAYLGAYHPWPPVLEPEYGTGSLASIVTNPIGGNLAAWMQEHVPSLSLTRKVEETFISPNEKIRTAYLQLFYWSKNPPQRQ